MSVLTRDAILDEMRRGRLRVEPLEPDQVGPASIDLHLGGEVRVLAPPSDGPVQVRDDVDPPLETETVSLDEPYVLEPGQTILGITRERVFLPPDLCGWLEGRSRVARLGLTVHVTSGFVHPGVCNHQVLEMTNVSNAPLVIHAGARLCQIVLERTEGEAVYSGRYADQRRP